MIVKNEYDDCLNYIRHYWKQITCYHPKDKQLHLGLPNRYVSPNNNIFKNDQFYWDSYFTILGLVKSEKIDLAKGMIDNFCFMFNRFKIIPMRNRYYNLGTSQIPFLTSMALEVFAVKKDLSWLKKTMKVAELELQNYWMNAELTEKHLVYKGLSRYCDHFITHLGSEHESGWDMTSRFNDRCLDYLPIDLNTALYKYETDLSMVYKLFKNKAKYIHFKTQAENRKKQIVSLMWNKDLNFFFDYNYTKKQQNLFYSVAGFYPLWANLATAKQAKLIRDYALPIFEHEGGIANTQSYGLSEDIKQHDYPNGWPHQQWIVIQGLINYGYNDDAKRIARKWLDMNAKIFRKTGLFWEKHNVIKCDVGLFNPNRYPTQSGFAWTNAIFVRLTNEFGMI
ncbi:MAG: trehalase family glycosidase [Bacteroidota bacterium]|nr:trehalase family glycosidase [Bacteroidota bacterium]